MRTIKYITAMFLWGSVAQAQDKPRVVFDEKNYDYVLANTSASTQTVWYSTDPIFRSGTDKRVLVNGYIRIVGVAPQDTIDLSGWKFYMQTNEDGYNIVLDNVMFRCRGCEFIPACEDISWDGIALTQGAGIRLENRGTKRSKIEHARKGIQVGIFNAYTNTRTIRITYTDFWNCGNSITLQKLTRNFVSGASKPDGDWIGVNTFRHDNSPVRAKRGTLSWIDLPRKPVAIRMEQGDYYKIQVSQNEIQNVQAGIIVNNGHAHITNNRIEDAETGIACIGDYAAARKEYVVRLTNNRVILPSETHVFPYGAASSSTRKGIYTAVNSVYVGNNTISTKATHTTNQGGGVEYTGIEVQSTQVYQVMSNTIAVRDNGLCLRNDGVVPGYVIGNTLTDHYHNVRFLANVPNSNPTIALRCNTIQINTLDLINDVPKSCITIDEGTTLGRLGGNKATSANLSERACGNIFSIPGSILNNATYIDLWKHITSSNGAVFTYWREPGEMLNPNNKPNLPGTVIACSTSTYSSGCNLSVQAQQNIITNKPLLSERGIGMSPADLSQAQQALDNVLLSHEQRMEAVKDIIGYHTLHKDIDGLSGYAANRPIADRYRAMLEHALYVLRMAEDKIALAMQHRENIRIQGANDTEVQLWNEHQEVHERMGGYMQQVSAPTSSDSTRLRDISLRSRLSGESACRRVQGTGGCELQTFSSMNKQGLNLPADYWEKVFALNTGLDTLNLVPNYSFEPVPVTSCPSIDSVYDPLQNIWTVYDTGTVHFVGWPYKKYSPDLFLTCHNRVSGLMRFYGNPNNWRGYQHAATGVAYSGGYIGGGLYTFECMGTQLREAMDTSKAYYVGFKTVLSETSYFAQNKQGVLFTMQPYTENKNREGTVPRPNRSHVYSDSIIRDTLHWQVVLKKFKPDSAYQYITLGNMFRTGLTSYEISINPDNPPCDMCYYFDDVVVTEDSMYAQHILYGVPYTNTHKAKEERGKRVRLHPNPTTGKVTIQMPEAERVRIYHAVGILIKEIDLSAGEHEIDLSTYPAGMYVVHIGREHHKLMKE